MCIRDSPRKTDEESAVIAASRKGNLVILEKLVALGAEVDLRDEAKSTGLMWAVTYGFIEVAEFLLENGADANAVGGGRTILDHVRKGPNLENLIKLLLHHGAEPNVTTPLGANAYEVATADGEEEKAKILRRHVEP